MTNPAAVMQDLLAQLAVIYPAPGQMLHEENFWHNEGAKYVADKFKKEEELEFYLAALAERGDLLELKNGWYKISAAGWEKLAQLEQDRNKSLLCFVAMSFDPVLNHLYTDAIKPACEATGFEALRIDDGHHPDAEQTINDAIIAGIKRSRFCIADFTQHRGGVYFEAGYALGRGLKVIYTCHRDEFAKAHFDTSHYPHLVYDTAEELRGLLINKIEAWIKD